MAANTDDSHKKGWLRWTVVGLLIALGAVFAIGFTTVRWVERQVLNTDNWVSFIGPLPKQAEVSAALGDYVANRLFENNQVEQKIQQALPEQAAFLASPLADNLKELTTRLATRVISSDQFQSVWIAANRLAHNRVVSTARGETSAPQISKPDVLEKYDLDLSGVKNLIIERLGSASSAVQTDRPISLSADLKAKRDKLHQYIRTADFLYVVLPIAAIASFLWALALAIPKRRVVLLIISGVMIALTLLQLIGVKALRPEIINQIQNASYRPGAAYIYDSLTKNFNQIAINWLIFWIVVFIFGVLAGPAKWAVTLRGYLRSDSINKSRPMAMWHSFRAYVARYKWAIWAGLALIVLAVLAFGAATTWTAVLNGVLVLICLLALVQLIATPTYSRPE